MHIRTYVIFFFFFNDTATTEIYTLSLHDALPISFDAAVERRVLRWSRAALDARQLGLGERECPSHALEQRRSEEHTSELQSPCNLVCRLLLEKKNKYYRKSDHQLYPTASLTTTHTLL